jgi:hypothetical protein
MIGKVFYELINLLPDFGASFPALWRVTGKACGQMGRLPCGKPPWRSNSAVAYKPLAAV